MDIRKIDRSSMEKLNERQICVTGRTFYKMLAGPDNYLQKPDIRRLGRSSEAVLQRDLHGHHQEAEIHERSLPGAAWRSWTRGISME